MNLSQNAGVDFCMFMEGRHVKALQCFFEGELLGGLKLLFAVERQVIAIRMR